MVLELSFSEHRHDFLIAIYMPVPVFLGISRTGDMQDYSARAAFGSSKLCIFMRCLMNNKILLVQTAVVVALSIPAGAAPQVPPTEVERIDHIARDGMMEVTLGKLAEEHASSPAVKDFAKRMVHDHSEANDKLKQAAQKCDITLPAGLSPKQKNMEQELSQISGGAFDRKYMSMMVSDHDKAVSALKEESQQGTGILQDWAEQTLPTIKSHRQEAERVDAEIKKIGSL